jgi:hypothetical protein
MPRRAMGMEPKILKRHGNPAWNRRLTCGDDVL